MHCIVPNGWANERWVSLPQTTCTDSRILFSLSLSAHSNAAIFAHSPHFTLSHSLLPCHTLGPYVPYALWYLLSHIECWRAQFIAAQLAALAHIWHMYVNKRQSTGGVSNYWWKIPWTALFLIFARSPSSAVCVTTSSEKLWVGVLAQKNRIIIEKKVPKREWVRATEEGKNAEPRRNSDLWTRWRFKSHFQLWKWFKIAILSIAMSSKWFGEATIIAIKWGLSTSWQLHQPQKYTSTEFWSGMYYVSELKVWTFFFEIEM